MPRISDGLYKVLPVSATELERALCKLVPFDNILDPVIPKLTTNKLGTAEGSHIPDDYLPWLILEYGISWIQDYIADNRTCVSEGLLINRTLGTRAAVRQAMGWIGHDSVTIFTEPELTVHFPEWQIDPGVVIGSLSDIFKMWKLGTQVQPARSRFRRIFNGLNIPVFRLDYGYLDDALLDQYSGIRFDSLGFSTVKTDLIVSFQRQITDAITGHLITAHDSYLRTNNYQDAVAFGDWPILDNDWSCSFSDNRDSVQDGYSRIEYAHDDAGNLFLDDAGNYIII